MHSIGAFLPYYFAKQRNYWNLEEHLDNLLHVLFFSHPHYADGSGPERLSVVEGRSNYIDNSGNLQCYAKRQFWYFNNYLKYFNFKFR